MVLTFIIFFSALGSIGAISAAAVFLLFPEKLRKVLVPCLVSYAIGTLSAGAFLGLIPTALEQIPIKSALLTVLAGIISFFVLERTLLWRHYHEEHYTIHGTISAPMILLGDAFHNFVDGAVIAASFVVSISLGIASSLAIIAHEIPQEVADFGVLLASGYSRQKAFLYNTISASTTIAGGIIAYLFIFQLQIIVPYIMAISASSFIYISLADLVPHLHHRQRISLGGSIRQLLLILAGIATVAIFVW